MRLVLEKAEMSPCCRRFLLHSVFKGCCIKGLSGTY